MADELRILTPAKASPSSEKKKEWLPGKKSQLNKVKAGCWIKVLAIQLADPARSKLYDQGFIENQKAQVIHNDFRGRIVLNIDGDIYLLGRRETAGIQVQVYV